VPEVDDVSPARQVGKVAAGVVQSAAGVNGAAAGLQRLRNSVGLFNDKNQQFHIFKFISSFCCFYQLP
jgi:hypothetical protein